MLFDDGRHRRRQGVGAPGGVGPLPGSAPGGVYPGLPWHAPQPQPEPQPGQQDPGVPGALADALVKNALKATILGLTIVAVAGGAGYYFGRRSR